MLKPLKHKFITLLQLILVIVYIIFEEIIWEGVAHPIYRYVHSLKILQKVEEKLHAVNAYVILILFMVMLASVEALGLYAGYLFVSGNVAIGLSIYLTKIPIAAFTFWMFRVTEDKLMQFGWFKWLYERIMAFIDWLKSLEIYQSTMQKLKVTKERIKQFFRAIKEKYFSKESAFVTRMKRLYNSIKQTLKRQ
jgi:hypothetical protein